MAPSSPPKMLQIVDTLKATNAEEICRLLGEMPPEYITVDTTQPPLLQAISVLTSLRSHYLTEGTPCSPRLLVQPVDHTGAPVENLQTHTTFRARTRDVIREPIGYSKAKIRQAAKDPRATRWEESWHMEQSEANKRSGSVDGRHGSSTSADGEAGALIDEAVHGFLTANYGSTLRYTAETLHDDLHDDLSDGSIIRKKKEEHASLAQPLAPELASEALTILSKAMSHDGDGWDFDPFSLSRATGDHSLLFFGYHAFRETGLLTHFGIDHHVVLRWLERIESSYKRTPYHNRDHACDVLQGCFWLLNAYTDITVSGGSERSDDGPGSPLAFCTPSSPGGSQNATSPSSPGGGGGGDGSGEGDDSRVELRCLLEPTDILAILIAAIGHDVEHTGQNNAFHVASSSPIAVLYNDRSVLENHHAATLFKLARDEKSNLFAPLPVAQRREVRDLIVSMVLGTDMSVHFTNVNRLRGMLEADGGNLDLEKKDDKSFVLEMVIHSADVANPTRSEWLYRQWTERVMQEFYVQGDLEKQNGLPVSNFYDRSQPNVPKCQLGFIDYVVAPLFKAMGEMLEIDVLTSRLQSNRAVMEQEAAAATAS